jgi:hypothetical protein
VTGEFNQIDSIERVDILNLLGTIPPEEYLNYCDTDDRLANFIELKIMYTALRIRFWHFWIGEELPETPGIDPEFLTLFQTEKMRFYELIQHGWREIREEFDRRGLDLASYATSPGEAFRQVLKDECRAAFETCIMAYHEFSPNRHRKFQELTNKLSQETDAQKKIKIQAQINAITVRDKHIPRQVFMKFCFIDACREASKHDKCLKMRLRDYDTASADLDAWTNRQLHPRKGRKGWKLVNGVKKPLA